MTDTFDNAFSKAEMEAIRRAAREEDSVLRDAWAKARAIGRRIPFAEDVLASYYCVADPATPRRVKFILAAALAYFVLPTDAIADFLPLLGFTDDAAVLAGAIASVAGSITDQHRLKAREALANDA